MAGITALLRFSGRSSRLEFWRWFLLSSILSAALYVGVVFVAMGGFPGSSVIAAAGLGAIALLLCPACAVTGRRLHDRGKAAWWLVVFYALPIALWALASALQIHRGVSIAQAVLILAAWIVDIWGWIELGFLRGARGPNRFGPEPSRR